MSHLTHMTPETRPLLNQLRRRPCSHALSRRPLCPHPEVSLPSKWISIPTSTRCSSAATPLRSPISSSRYPLPPGEHLVSALLSWVLTTLWVRAASCRRHLHPETRARNFPPKAPTKVKTPPSPPLPALHSQESLSTLSPHTLRLRTRRPHIPRGWLATDVQTHWRKRMLEQKASPRHGDSISALRLPPLLQLPRTPRR